MLQLFGELGDLAYELCSNSKKLLLKSSDIFSKWKSAKYSQKINMIKIIARGSGFIC